MGSISYDLGILTLLQRFNAILPSMAGLGGSAYYFRDCCITAPVPHRAFAVSAVWHVGFVLLIVPLSRYIPVPTKPVVPHVQITWYGPINDLPLIFPQAPAGAPPMPASKPETGARPQPAADAFHPRQTIVNTPMRPNHPRQTLIQPAASPAPPTILPNLPNIVEWDTPNEPQAPQFDPETLRLRQPKAAERAQQQAIEAPQLTEVQPLGPIDIVSSAASKPALPVDPMSAPRVQARRTIDVAAPEISAQGRERAIDRSFGHAGTGTAPGDAGRKSLGASGDFAGRRRGGVRGDSKRIGHRSGGLRISGGRATSNVSGAGLRVMPGLPARPGASAAAPAAAGVAASRSQPSSLLDRIQPGMAPEALLGPKRVYTLRFSMPNLSSATGSWVLSFTRVGWRSARNQRALAAPAELSGPTALRKVDPKYPPELRDKHVEGEVVLYAVIRADGTVDSIQLVRGIDPTLDTNAMQALAQWKFRAAEREGVPVDIETVVRIPFRAVAPVY